MPMRHQTSQRGASAMFIAGTMLLLIGAAAIAIDIGAGFNERRQTQTAADVAVMAGALEATFLAPNSSVSEETLRIARQNTSADFGDPSNQNDPIWVDLWRSCTDTGRPADFQPLDEPVAWASVTTPSPSTGTLDCISRNSSFLRVRMPDQTVQTSFARVIGASELNTYAVAIALINTGVNNPPVVPYGIAGGVTAGETCFGSGPTGTAYAPCDGPSAGTFGTLLSEFFGAFYGSVDCGNPGATEVATQTALGVDHVISTWLNPDGLPISKGDPWPGDGTVLGYTDANRDACDDVAGEAIAVDGFPVNTVRVDTGFAGADIERGMVSDETFFGQPSRLQQDGEHFDGTNTVSNDKRDIIARRTGANEDVWELDNHGPWDYLLSSAVSVDSTCNPATYTTGMDEFEKAERFEDCLSAYVTSGSTAVIFDDYLDQSPRFVWAPQYWFTLPTTGSSWEPVHSFRIAFIAGTFFNCDSASGACDVVFYPDADQNAELCDVSGGGCQQLNLNQISAWVLPDTAANERIRNSFPGGQTPFAPELFR